MATSSPYGATTTDRDNRRRPTNTYRAYGEEQFSLKIHLSASKDIKPNAFYFIEEDENTPQQGINCYDCIKIFEHE